MKNIIESKGNAFSTALIHLKLGARCHRKGWNGTGMYIELQVPNEKSKMSLPYIYIKTSCGNRVPWLASQADLLTDDWTTALGSID